MLPKNKNRKRSDFRVRVLFGLFEVDGNGAVGVAFAFAAFIVISAMRWLGFW